jgi:ABC-type lipoprotein release transport system permease subunit
MNSNNTTTEKNAMITTIDNNQRVFQIQKQGWQNRSIFCNMADIEKAIKDNLEPHDQYKIYQFWDGKQKPVSKKLLKEFLTANQLNTSFIK